MPNSTPAPKAGTSTRRRRRRRTPAANEKLRRARATATVQAVTIAKMNGSPVVPAEPPARLYMRRDVLTPDEFGAMLASCSSSSRIGMRDRALLCAAYYGCLRGDELACLGEEDVDTACGVLTVRNSRTKRLRYVALGPEHFEPIAEWAERRAGLYKVRERVGFFCSLAEGEGRGHLSGGHSGSASTPEITTIIERIAKTAKVKKPAHPGALRRARVKELALAGAALPDLAALLDLKDLVTARQFVTEVAPHAPATGHFERTVQRENLAAVNARKVGKPAPNAGKKYPPEVLTPNEVLAILQQCSPRTTTGLRDRALIVVLWRCGLRIAEALDLEHRDINLVEGMITVRSGKGDKRRIVGIDEQACAVIGKWLEHRATRLALPESGTVFCTIQLPTRGGQLAAQTFRSKLKLLGKQAGIKKRVHPHGLRHTHAYELMKEGVPLMIIQKQLGHTELSMTAKYMDHLNPREVVAALTSRVWGETP
jgi:site-specific recombinase XerD